MCRSLLLLVLSVALALPGAAQSSFDVEAYKAFLSANRELSAEGLLQLHAAGDFAAQLTAPIGPALHRDDIAAGLDLTADEQQLLDRHGFVVTERLFYDSFGNALLDIYKKDLPVFISTDALLHALHMSYDRILMDVEQQVLIGLLDGVLADLHGALPALAARYDGVAEMRQPLIDLDVYLTIPRALLAEGTVPPVFPESQATVQELLDKIASEEGISYPLFVEDCRLYDFSQFTVRGHYTREPELARYFQAMIWLGRTELYLIAPETDICPPTEADVQRQTLAALLLAEAADLAGAHPRLEQFDEIIRLFVGDSDNVTLPNLLALREMTGVQQASDLLDVTAFAAFQDTLAQQAWAGQRILSQMLSNQDPLAPPDQIQPASAFLLLGQRFVIDSYVTGSVVFDKVEHQGVAVKRMLPSTLDVLFALGNDAAGQLLQDELARYHYAPNLAALRYLIDSYEPDFWRHSIYNGWLDAIRTLVPPEERGGLPAFMQTAAFWQQKMNTQLAAWAQLRHDNLLYAKQSYTGIPGCSYPFVYVEPLPAFYRALGRFAESALDKVGVLEQHDANGGLGTRAMLDYFDHLKGVSDTLATVALKELAGTAMTAEEDAFLQRVLFEKQDVCYTTIDGWYPRLFYGGNDRAKEADLVVADIHTTPADENGNIVGWVLHAGTGPVDVMVMATEVPGVGPVAFAGPVMSYYEHLSTGFDRLTDERWQTAYAAAPSFRPALVDVYLADGDGRARGGAPLLATGVESVGPIEQPGMEGLRLAANYPNPFSERTVVGFTVPAGLGHEKVEVEIYDVQGRRVRRLLSQALPPGHYTLDWDGTRDDGAPLASGAYFCRLTVGAHRATQTMTLLR